MTEFILGIVVIVVYRAFTIACGLVIVYLGFVLFRLGVYEKAGELKAVWGSKNLSLKQAAPGTFFALFGAAIIASTVWRGLDFESVRTRPPPAIQRESNAGSDITPMTSTSPAAAVLQSLDQSGARGMPAPQVRPNGLSDNWLDQLFQPIESTIHYSAFRTPTEAEKKSPLLPFQQNEYVR